MPARLLQLGAGGAHLPAREEQRAAERARGLDRSARARRAARRRAPRGRPALPPPTTIRSGVTARDACGSLGADTRVRPAATGTGCRGGRGDAQVQVAVDDGRRGAARRCVRGLRLPRAARGVALAGDRLRPPRLRPRTRDRRRRRAAVQAAARDSRSVLPRPRSPADARAAASARRLRGLVAVAARLGVPRPRGRWPPRCAPCCVATAL
jgi:hypothetical protein